MTELSANLLTQSTFLNNLKNGTYNVQGNRTELIEWLTSNPSSRVSARQGTNSGQSDGITLSFPKRDGTQELNIFIRGNNLTYEITDNTSFTDFQLPEQNTRNSQN